MESGLDMSQYLDLFLQEAEEQIEILERETLQLEREPSNERLQVIFRAAHTLKGSSRAMGFSHFAELTHEMENVLDQLRNGHLAVSTPIADALLACIDTLSQMATSIGEGQGDGLECGVLVARLQALQAHPQDATPPKSSPPLGSSNAGATCSLSPDQRAELTLADAECPVYHAAFQLHAECVMKFVRAFMAISMVQEEGELLLAFPSTDALEEEQFEQDFELVFQSAGDIESMRARLATISELESVTVRRITEIPSDSGVTAEPVSSGEVIELPTPASAPSSAPNSAPVPTPASAELPAANGAGAAKKSETGQTVRVDVARLDNLMNLVGELVIDRTRIAQIGNDLASRHSDQVIDEMLEAVGHIARITSDLQDQLMKARMLPIETVFNRFPRVVRDLAQKLGKDVRLDLVGGDTELDRSVIEVIGDPLLHIIRNSVDHGIEGAELRAQRGKSAQGHVKVTARHQENHIVIEIEDDGGGIDVERVRAKAISSGLIETAAAAKLSEREVLQFIFHSGLSTAAQVSEVSGRGVGMDIVRSNIQKLGGLIDLETRLGEGTKFTLRLPLTLAIIRGLLVQVKQQSYVLPLTSVVETLLVSPNQIQRVNQREVIVIRGQTTPLVRMNESMRLDTPASRVPQDLYVVIVGLAEQRIGLVVDRLIGEQEVVIKSLSRFCGDVQGINGATILGDGNVALIVDVNGVVNAENQKGKPHGTTV